MQDKKKKTLLLIGITLLTLALGGVAVVTALRLQKLATVPVAPNVPQSQPQAAVAPVEINGCFGSFDIAPQQCSQTCTSNADCAGEGSLQCITGMCRNPHCSEQTDCLCPLPTPTITPTPTPLASCNNGCTVDADCDGDLICEGAVCRNASCVTETDCTCNVPEPTATPTPTPLASCNNGCNIDSDCQSGLTCEGGACRNPACTAQTNCSCPVPTPSTTLRASNTPQPTATLRPLAPTNTPAPTPVPALPQAGVSAPLMIVLSVGLLVLLGGLLGIAMW